MTKIRLAALGSSFAAGPGIDPMEDATAGRSSRNYAHRLADKLGADLTDLTVSGATLLNVLNERQYLGRYLFEPQLAHLPEDTDIVTVTCGGNDIGYIGCLTQDSLMSYLGQPEGAFTIRLEAPFLDLHQLASRLLAVLDKIHVTAPKAKVYLVEYPSIIGSDTTPWVDVALSKDRMAHYEAVAGLLSQAYHVAAKGLSWVEVTPVAKRSRGHGLGSKEAWVDGFNLSMVTQGRPTYHANIAGHTAIAHMLYEQITAER